MRKKHRNQHQVHHVHQRRSDARHKTASKGPEGRLVTCPPPSVARDQMPAIEDKSLDVIVSVCRNLEICERDLQGNVERLKQIATLCKMRMELEERSRPLYVV